MMIWMLTVLLMLFKQIVPRKAILAIVSVTLFVGCAPQTELEELTKNVQQEQNQSNQEPSATEKLTTADVHFIDVGQGDATLLIGPDFTVLVDAGRHDQNDVVQYLKKLGITNVDVLIGTHPHSDHIGQMEQVMEQFDVKEVWLSGDEHSSVTFDRTLQAILDNNVDYYEPRANEIFFIGSLTIEILNPRDLQGDIHENGIILTTTYGNTSFLFTGDSEVATEQLLLRNNKNIKANVFQLGHHGSSTSNHEAFLKAINPEIAIYSAEKNNTYGHPHKEVISLLHELQIPVYGTDKNGTIVISTDGNSVSVNSSLVVTNVENRLEHSEQQTVERQDCININEASLEQLQEIVHIGLERAEEIISLRPFTSIDQLTKVYGIGKGRLKDIKKEGTACVQ